MTAKQSTILNFPHTLQALSLEAKKRSFILPKDYHLPLNPYSSNYMECIEEAKVRTREHNAPIKENIPDISEYEVIYVGSPIYWGGMPEELFTALKGHDYNGKIIRPFTTHEGSGLSGVPRQLNEICVGAEIASGLAIVGSQVNNSKARVEEWI